MRWRWWDNLVSNIEPLCILHYPTSNALFLPSYLPFSSKVFCLYVYWSTQNALFYHIGMLSTYLGFINAICTKIKSKFLPFCTFLAGTNQALLCFSFSSNPFPVPQNFSTKYYTKIIQIVYKYHTNIIQKVHQFYTKYHTNIIKI